MTEKQPGIRLIVNADDFGQTRGVNEGIIKAHRKGILTSATLMANQPHLDHALELARDCPDLGLGVHVNLTTGPSLARPGQSLPGLKQLLLGAWMPGMQHQLRAEICAQIAKLVEAGVRPTHLDSHKHVMAHPRIMRAAIEVAREFGIEAIRFPYEDGRFNAAAESHGSRKSKLRVAFVNVLAAQSSSIVKRSKIRTADKFFGIAGTGDWTPESMARAVDLLRPGITEMMVHPGLIDDDLRSSGTRLLESREAELRALTSPEVAEAIREKCVRLASYKDLE